MTEQREQEQTPPERSGVVTMVPPGDPRAAIWEVIRGPWRFIAVHCLVELGCIDELAQGPLSAGDLARRCGADQSSLLKILRSATAMGILRAEDHGAYALSQAGQTLRSDVPRSMHSAILATGEAASWEAMRHLTDTARSGQPSFHVLSGTSWYGYLAAHPDEARIFQEFMTTRSAWVADALVEHLDFTGAHTVADIGGGNGSILAAILAAYPQLRGILFEMDAVLPGARDYLTRAGIAERCELIAGDYFAVGDVPAADTYLLANIIHNYSDDEARKIIANVLAAASGEPRVLLADLCLPDRPEPHVGFDLAVRMMVLGAGTERTRAAYVGLLESAGLRAEQVIDPGFAVSIIDTRPATGSTPAQPRTGPASRPGAS